MSQNKIINEIEQLFKTRDNAVLKQERKHFLSTQVAEIKDGSSDGYIGIKRMKSDVLCVHQENSLETIVFVKETYFPPRIDSYSSFPVYYLVKTVEGWKIYKVK